MLRRNINYLLSWFKIRIMLKNKVMRLLVLFVFLLGLVSCGEDEKSSTSNTTSENKAEVFPKTLKEYDLFKDVYVKFSSGIGLLYDNKNRDSLITGIIVTKYPNGEIESKKTIKNGKSNGLERGWNNNGIRSIELNWKDGKKDGIERRWYYGGDLHKKINWKEGELISEECWDIHGNKIEC